MIIFFILTALSFPPISISASASQLDLKSIVNRRLPFEEAIPPFSIHGDPDFFSNEELAARLEEDVSFLGSLCIGTVESGVLLNSVPMRPDPKWDIVNPYESWGTEETIGFIRAAIEKVHEVFADTPPLYIGDISHPGGGTLNRHASHQAGRDADLGFYYKAGKSTWYTPGTARSLDLPRNWTLLRALLTYTDIECILLDIRIQKLIYSYALSIGEDPAWLNSIFQYPTGRRRSLIRHVKRHHTHYHVRFYNRRAQSFGQRAYRPLLEMKKIQAPVYYVRHRVRSGQTLSHLARRYRTSIRAIQKANGLNGSLIRAGKTYRIPCKGSAAAPREPIIVPDRPLPRLTPKALAAVNWPLADPTPSPTPHVSDGTSSPIPQ